ncbi:protein DBF4 homolog A [Gouania willdenowi]|uniref:protein DBF4 homolog A n=1 Tax=Gouania willdenowi TaxID=441366 RepID=UPI0010552CF7|nr:protein DBF4 homolog A [Gouania willdenowi]
MMPKRSQRRTAVNCHGTGGVGDEPTLTKTKQPSLISSRVQVKPFAGKVFYLDLPSNRTAETLETDIRQLGGTVEKFFSKEIKYLISNKREARYIHCLRQDSPVSSPDSGQSSPLPGSKPHHPSHVGSTKSRPLGQPETVVKSRGKSLVDKVVSEQERVKINKILSNALDWGVKILYIDDVLAYIQKKKVKYQIPSAAAVKSSVKAQLASRQGFSKCKERRIRKPFIKVEDSSRNYRSIFLTLPNMPVFNLKTVAPCSPFCTEDKTLQGNRKQGQSKDKSRGRKKNKDKKRSGYCECCLVKYEDLTMHLQSIGHKTFSWSDKYLVVDRLVSTLQCNFIHSQSNVKRKCSVSSVLLAPGLSRKTNPRHKEDPDASQTVKDKKRRTDWCEESHSGQLKKLLLSNDTALQSHAEDKQTDCCIYSDPSQQRFPARKKSCRQNSQTSCSQKNEADVYQFKSETEAPRDEVIPLSSSHIEDTHLQHKEGKLVPSEQQHFEGNVLEMLFEGVQDTRESLEKEREKNLPQETDGHISAPNSPVQRIQRKVKIYKHKRRKIDTNHEQVKKPCEKSDCSLLRLWELFQSSDDMEVEFHGFED